MWFFLLFPAALMVAGAIYQVLCSARDTRLKAPGRMLLVQGRKMHINDQGSGSPTVVLESGISASSLSWSALQPRIAEFTRVVSYDRAGFAWSEASNQPRTPAVLARELRELLMAAQIAPPYILIGHSFGGLIVRAFTSLDSKEVAGLVLLDALHENEWMSPSTNQRRVLMGGVLFSRIGAVLSALGVVRLCLALLNRGARRTPKNVLRLFGSTATKVVERVLGEITKLPADVLPAIRAHWSRPRSFWTMSSYLAALPSSSAEIKSLPIQAAIPLVVLSACSDEPRRRAEQQELASICEGGEQVFVAECGHWVHLDQPDAVLSVLRRIVERTRAVQQRV